MLRLCTRTLVKVGMVNPCGLVKFCNFVKPVSATLVTIRDLSNQSGLPRLPLPTLQQSFERYLSALEPIVEEDELKNAKELAEEFQKAGGDGVRLQRQLEMSVNSMDNWLTDAGIYYHFLSCRRPVVVYSNVGYVLPQMDVRDKHGQIRCAAGMIAAVLELKTMIDNQTLPAEYMNQKPLCMKQYSQMLSSCRIPGLETDSVEFHAKSSNPPKHITVVHNSQFFVVEVYNSDGTPLTIDHLCVQLERICNSSPETNTVPVGILTTLDRDSWSKTYISLIKDKTNKESVSAIEGSICTVCLDGAMPPVNDESYFRCAGFQMIHGGGSQWNSANRWFDKGLQLIIGQDGTHGFNMSHTVADGTTFMTLADHIVTSMRKPETVQSPVAALPLPQKLHFKITADVKNDIEEAKRQMSIITQDLDLRVKVFKHFGKNVPKVHKMSPDAFIQMALQLAYYRLYQQCCPSFEAASLRMFREGRLDIILTTTNASAAFIKGFDDPTKQNKERVDLLDKAVKEHQLNIQLGINGEGLHGHLLCLKLLSLEEKLPMPNIFTDISWAKLCDFRLGTSQVQSKTGSLAFFNLIELIGYHLIYFPSEKHITFTAIASTTCKENNVPRMIRAVEDALLDMRTLLEQTQR